MPWYVSLLTPLAMLVVASVLASWLARKTTTPKRGWATAAVVACLAVGVAVAGIGWPLPLIAGENPAGEASQQADNAQPDAEAAGGGAAAEAVPSPNGAEPTPGQDKAAGPEAEQPAAPEAEQPAAGPEQAEPADAEKAKPSLESLSEKSLFGLLRAAKQTLTVLNAHEDETRIEQGLVKSLLSLLLLIVSVTVLIGPFFLALRFTGGWRQPLWGWPIGLAVFGVAGAAAVFLIRLVLAPLPEAYGYEFLRFLLHAVLFRNLWIAAALVAVPAWLGAYLSRKWRMPEYSGRIGIVSFCVLAGLVVATLGWPPKLGIDLSGGVILVYSFEDRPGGGAEDEGDQGGGGESQQGEDLAGEPVDMEKLIHAIRLRVDPSNLRELTIRPRGERQIEVIIPLSQREEKLQASEGEFAELERIKKKISSAGTLEFRILANRRDHEAWIKRAKQEGARELYEQDQNGNRVLDKEGHPILLAWWVPVARGEEEGFLRFAGQAETEQRKRTYRGYEWTEFLVVKDIFDVNGGYLVRATTGIDQSARPNVLFTFNQRGGRLFGGLTGNNLPNEAQEFSRHLGIVLDGYLQSAPAIRSTIFEQGEITGDFTRREVEDLVDILNAGSLPTALSEEPISETRMGPGLGQDTIDRGRIAIVISLALVLGFMLVYYRFAGVVACMALVMNLVLILAIMISVKAAFTLPGLAGLVLTVGMAVDANVLIYERIREELARQATLRMAIRNGFSRATTTIIDANLTTLITATVLYVIGNDQIKGFAVTLWLGVVLSMFTAIYCARLVFDVAEKQKWITRLTMLEMLGKTQIDFLSKRWLAVGASAVLILIGLVAVVGRGSGLLDIDFTGGVSVETVFREPKADRISDIRSKLGEQGEGLQDLAVSGVQTLENPVEGLRFLINTSGPRDMKRGADSGAVLARVEEHIKNAFGKELAHRSLEFTILPSPAGPGASETGEQPAQTGAEKTTANRLPAASLLASTDPSAVLLAQAESPPEGPSSDDAPPPASADAAAPGDAPGETPAGQSAPPAPDEAPKPATEQPAGPTTEQPAAGEAGTEPSPDQTRAKLQFQHNLDYEGLADYFKAEVQKQEQAGILARGSVRFELFLDEDFTTVDHDAVQKTWFVKLNLPPDQGQALLSAIEQRVESEPVFPSSNSIGSQVARRFRVDGMAALFASLVFIVGYIWIRFQRVIFGLAAVIALIHDVLVTLGLIALSAYLVWASDYLASFISIRLHEFLIIDEFKIGLPVLAAFMTIIGYSLNDTIVIFDRIREIRGKSPQLTVEMINTSVNQTLSRTLLTSLTTWIVVVVLYIGGGQAIHVFAFALVVGVVAGTYSTIYIASPLLLWMANAQAFRQQGKAPRRAV